MSIEERAKDLAARIWNSRTERSIYNLILYALQKERNLAAQELYVLEARIDMLVNELDVYKRAVDG